MAGTVFHIEKVLPLLEESTLLGTHDRKRSFRAIVWTFPATDEASGEESLEKLL